ncbi:MULTISPECIES: PIG-L deacetylase family protein [unclassified Meiothermus]|uniref:PIG-L deacetylase family protein n=1 Tax=unclassified Meiothermus TaxID=370471 RepID=UPI000D7C6D82|nr:MULTISPECIES: PIG-L deacetylase family protein [unclassified Meiothermus]PZA08442.1 PIG-L family deacetylase [Meiothermus sp. Pnk-1]RYM37111.1 PIG-L family deacetylase [Meiothermus sp. PNK-Is4]
MRLMAIFPHPDDEIGVSGTLAKHARRGDAVKLVWLTRGELASQFGDTPPEEVAQIREGHGRAVAQILGAEYEFLGYPDAGLTGGREEALMLAQKIAAWKPDVVFTWDPYDVHPDHRAAYWATLSALKFCRIPKLVGVRAQPPALASVAEVAGTRASSRPEGLGENGGGVALEAHRSPVRLLHYYRSDLPRPAIYVDISETIEVAEEVFRLYQAFYRWEYSPEAFRASRARLGQEAGVKFAERFQSEGPLPLGYLPG